MKEILDRLAMEVHLWPSSYPGDLNIPGFMAKWKTTLYDYDIIAELKDGEVITESQWLSRRKELINEPSDSDAPEWAKWKAQDAYGVWRWFDGCPIEDGGDYFTPVDENWDRATKGKIPAGHSWKNTLKEVKHLIPAEEMLIWKENQMKKEMEEMDKFKEVKLAWANGDAIQFAFDDGCGWQNWQRTSMLNLNYADAWRVKPKTKTHTQWERKHYCSENHAVLLAINLESSDFPSNVMWVSEPEKFTYEVEI